MLNKNSCFTSGNLTRDNYAKLKIVLEKLKQNGTSYLEILHYHIEETIKEEESDELLDVGKMFGGMKNLMMEMKSLLSSLSQPCIKLTRKGTTES